MKFTKIATAGIAAMMIGTQAFAGGMAEPIMEPIIVEEEAGSSGGFVVPLLLLAVIAAVVAADD